MKTKFFCILPIILITLAGCQKEEDITPNDNTEKVTTEGIYTLTVEAIKKVDTKALALDGNTLNATWASGEKVGVYVNGTYCGQLNATPKADATKATLSGTLTSTAGIVADATILLLFPDRSDHAWDYTGQAGAAPGGDLAARFDYATATLTISEVNNVNNTVITNGTAAFQNEQSVYRFGFKDSGNYIDPKAFTVSAAGGQLVQSMSWNGSAWAADYGNISVTPASAPGDHFYYVSLRNDQTTDDTYNFTITGSDDVLYMASKGIPASVLDVPGKFISAKSVNATKPDFSPASGTTDTAL